MYVLSETYFVSIITLRLNKATMRAQLTSSAQKVWATTQKSLNSALGRALLCTRWYFAQLRTNGRAILIKGGNSPN